MFLIGLPVFAGIYVRYKSYGDHFYWHTFRVTIPIFFTISIGYSFIHYANPPEAVLSYNGFVGVWIYYLIGFFFVGAIMTDVLNGQELGDVVLAIIVCSFFIVVGGLFSIAGTLISGFNLAAVVYSAFFAGGIDNVFFWKDIFDFFDINLFIIRVFLLIVSAFSGAVEFVSYIHDHVLEH